MARRVWVLALGGVIAAVGCTGCGTYWRNRSRDAADIIDVGVTITKRPYIAFYPGDYFNLTPMGYTRLKGTWHGLYQGKWGSRAIDDKSWGIVAYGSQRLTVGEFNPEDPNQFWPDELAALKAANKPLPTKAKRYNVGFLRLACHRGRPPYPNCYSCRRNLHIGWVGFWASMHADEIFDFLAGFFGCDPLKDSGPAATPAAAPEKK